MKHLLEHIILVIGRAPFIFDVQRVSDEGGTGDVGQRMQRMSLVKQTHHRLPMHPHILTCVVRACVRVLPCWDATRGCPRSARGHSPALSAERRSKPRQSELMLGVRRWVTAVTVLLKSKDPTAHSWTVLTWIIPHILSIRPEFKNFQFL